MLLLKAFTCPQKRELFSIMLLCFCEWLSQIFTGFLKYFSVFFKLCFCLKKNYLPVFSRTPIQPLALLRENPVLWSIRCNTCSFILISELQCGFSPNLCYYWQNKVVAIKILICKHCPHNGLNLWSVAHCVSVESLEGFVKDGHLLHTPEKFLLQHNFCLDIFKRLCLWKLTVLLPKGYLSAECFW